MDHAGQFADVWAAHRAIPLAAVAIAPGWAKKLLFRGLVQAGTMLFFGALRFETASSCYLEFCQIAERHSPFWRFSRVPIFGLCFFFANREHLTPRHSRAYDFYLVYSLARRLLDR